MSIFQTVKAQRPKRNVFDLSHEKKLTMNMGDLVPMFMQEVVPGDTFKLNTEMLMRFMPLVSPVMHRINVFTHFFFVPNRLIWNEWQDFITGGEDGQSMPAFPVINFTYDSDLFRKGSLWDYLGLPVIPDGVNVDHSQHVSSLPFRAYQMIYNEYYRDQNFANTKVDFGIGSGQIDYLEAEELLTLRKRCWEKDYFTSALPFAQRGGDVMLPLQGSAPVVSDKDWNPTGQGAGIEIFQRNPPGGVTSGVDYSPSGPGAASGRLTTASGALQYRDGSLEVDLSEASQTTVSEFRRAVKLQEWLERNARGGSRYIEQILSHFGVMSSDARLQRPEYLGGGKAPVVISETLQTSSTDATTPQGNMAGHGISVGNTHGFKRFFEEHGFIIGIMSVLPRTAYDNCLPRVYSKFDKFDYYFPEFAHIGEQPVYNREVSYLHSLAQIGATTNADEINNTVFGYQSRYAEYKYVPSTVHGEMHDTLSFWHLARKLPPAPPNNAEFVSSQDVRHDIFAVEDASEHKLVVQLYNNCRALRPLPYFSSPRL